MGHLRCCCVCVRGQAKMHSVWLWLSSQLFPHKAEKLSSTAGFGQLKRVCVNLRLGKRGVCVWVAQVETEKRRGVCIHVHAWAVNFDYTQPTSVMKNIFLILCRCLCAIWESMQALMSVCVWADAISHSTRRIKTIEILIHGINTTSYG